MRQRVGTDQPRQRLADRTRRASPDRPARWRRSDRRTRRAPPLARTDGGAPARAPRRASAHWSSRGVPRARATTRGAPYRHRPAAASRARRARPARPPPASPRSRASRAAHPSTADPPPSRPRTRAVIAAASTRCSRCSPRNHCATAAAVSGMRRARRASRRRHRRSRSETRASGVRDPSIGRTSASKRRRRRAAVDHDADVVLALDGRLDRVAQETAEARAIDLALPARPRRRLFPEALGANPRSRAPARACRERRRGRPARDGDRLRHVAEDEKREQRGRIEAAADARAPRTSEAKAKAPPRSLT